MMMKQEEEEKKQIEIVDRATDKALKQVERERKGKQRNYIEDWFRYVELVGNRLRKHLN